MQKLISVVIPTYKRTELLKKCLRNIDAQSFDKNAFEVIVVSDGPDDATMQLTEAFKPSGLQISCLSSAVKKGPAAARNIGWQHAEGLLIAFTDDDCLPDPQWLQNIWKHYNYEREIVFTGNVIVPVSKEPTDFELNTKGLETGEFITANCVCTKAALQQTGGFDEAFTLAWREDSDLQFKLLKRQVPIVKLNNAVVTHPVRKAPWGVSIKEQKKAMFNALLYKKYPDLYRRRIKPHPAWTYYFTVLFFAIFLAAWLLKLEMVSLIALAGWLVLTVAFIIKRLTPARKTTGHILEMVVTSLAIPFLSIYWTLYGAIKYRVWFF